MIQSQTIYWAVCDICTDEGPQAYSEKEARHAADEIGWRHQKPELPIGLRAADLFVCPRCQEQK